MLVIFLCLNSYLCFLNFHHRPAIVAIALVLPLGLQRWKKKKSPPSGNSVILWKAFLNFWFSFCVFAAFTISVAQQKWLVTQQTHHRPGPLTDCSVMLEQLFFLFESSNTSKNYPMSLFVSILSLSPEKWSPVPENNVFHILPTLSAIISCKVQFKSFVLSLAFPVYIIKSPFW